MTARSAGRDMPGMPGVRWYRNGGGRLAAAAFISVLGIVPAMLVIHGLGYPIRWVLLIPGAFLVAAVAALASLPLRAGIGVTPDHILIRGCGHTRKIPWAQVTGFKAGKGGPNSKAADTLFVLTSDGHRWNTVGYDTWGSPLQRWHLMHTLEVERLARTPGAAATLLPPPPARKSDPHDTLLTILAVIFLIGAAGALYAGITGLGPAIRAAHGGGTAGYYIPQKETCHKGCTWRGEFRLPDGTVTRQDTFIQDLGSSELHAGVPVAARDSADSGGVFPRDDPGAWHVWADIILVGSWTAAWTLTGLIRTAAVRLRRVPPSGPAPSAVSSPPGDPEWFPWESSSSPD